jgi:Flp pilus assembly protein TadB
MLRDEGGHFDRPGAGAGEGATQQQGNPSSLSSLLLLPLLAVEACNAVRHTQSSATSAPCSRLLSMSAILLLLLLEWQPTYDQRVHMLARQLPSHLEV